MAIAFKLAAAPIYQFIPDSDTLRQLSSSTVVTAPSGCHVPNTHFIMVYKSYKGNNLVFKCNGIDTQFKRFLMCNL